MRENIGFTFLIFGMLVSAANAGINIYLKDRKINFETIGSCVLGALIVISPVYELGDTNKEGLVIFYSGFTISMIYLFVSAIMKWNQNNKSTNSKETGH